MKRNNRTNADPMTNHMSQAILSPTLCEFFRENFTNVVEVLDPAVGMYVPVVLAVVDDRLVALTASVSEVSSQVDRPTLPLRDSHCTRREHKGRHRTLCAARAPCMET